MIILPPIMGQEDDGEKENKKTGPELEEKVDTAEDKKENKKGKGNLQVDLSESLYFYKYPKAIANPQERSVKLFEDSLEGLPEGWKIRTLVVNKEKGTTQDHYLSPDGCVLKTGQGVMEYLWLGGKLGQEAIVNIGKDVLHLSDKKINAWLTLNILAMRHGNRIEEVDLTTLDDGDEDEVAFLEEVKVKEEEDLASNQDEAAKGVDEEKEPNAKDESLSSEERKGDEINLGKEGGLLLGLT